MNSILGQHELLVESGGRENAEQKARYFIDRNVLVRYDSVVIENKSIICGDDAEFLTKIENGLEANRQAINRLVGELRAERADDPRTWSSLRQGYTTKLLHTAIHLLDGFFGIDSVLYNLIENSHQVSDLLRTRINQHPENYWLVPVVGMSGKENADRVPMLRPFGREE